MNTANSGGRKPTADSHAYTLYKPNQHKVGPPGRAAKFSNGGGSIDGSNDEYANFHTGPNTTASRFYNPK